MNQQHDLFEQFRPALASSSDDKAFLLGRENEYALYYVPFEYVNADARLVLVGITPGPKQMKCAYATARRLLGQRTNTSEALRAIKQSCAFSGMRDKINAMLEHFDIPRCIGASSAVSLWGTEFDLFHPTSIVPNAAFRGGAYFNGPFESVLDVPLLRKQFEHAFILSAEHINKTALYIGMGPVVDEALAWCVSRGILAEQQVLGYFPHASGASGSQFAYFIRKRRLHDLKPKDPVRYRASDLDAVYDRIAANLKALFPQWRHAG